MADNSVVTEAATKPASSVQGGDLPRSKGSCYSYQYVARNAMRELGLGWGDTLNFCLNIKIL